MEMAISRGDIGSTETMKKSGEIVVSDPYKPLKHFILQALSFKKAGDSSQYNMLLEYVKDFQDGDGLIVKVLSHCVSQIDEKDHYQLLLQMFKPSLWKCRSEVQDAFLEFAIHLVSANGRCVQLCLEWLISNFFLPGRVPGTASAGAVGGTGGAAVTCSQEDSLAQKEEVCGKLHGAIKKVIELVPAVRMRLVPLILQRKPHRLLDKEMQCLYLENVLRLSRESTGTLSSRLLVAVVDHLIEIDVEIRWELIMEEKSAKDILVFDVDLDDDQEHKEGDINEWEVNLAEDGTEGAPGEEAILAKGQGRGKSFNSQSLQTLDAMADKMDCIMEMTFGYVQSQTEAGRLSEVFDALIHSFKTTILHTYKAKFVQFLIFYACSFSGGEYATKFAMLVVDTVVTPSFASTTRMCAAAYAASFLARAKYTSPSLVLDCIDRLVKWCARYIDNLNSRPGPDKVVVKAALPDAAVHGVFYSACQAFMYILCFRLEKLTEDSSNIQTLKQLPLQKIFEHSLNPLKICLQSVVAEFSRQCLVLRLYDCRKILEMNEQFELKTTTAFGGVNQLEMFFPFDPYLLLRSSRFVKDHYVKWHRPDFGEEEDDDDIDSDGEDTSDPDDSDDLSSSSSQDGDVGMTEMHCQGQGKAKVVHDPSGILIEGGMKLREPYAGMAGSSFSPMSFTPPSGRQMSASQMQSLPAFLPLDLH